jgi:AGCS family alanine or glycine:cation symporter
MIDFINLLENLESLLWSYLGLGMILLIGLYFSIKHRLYQITILVNPRKYIGELLSCAAKDKRGIHPIKLYFSSVGGMVGLGNLVLVVTVLTIGGPGSIVWLWIGSFLGMVVKYSEIYLGIKYRIKHKKGYDGGPMYFLQEAFKNSPLAKILPIIVCLLLCIYGAEISQFVILTDLFTQNFSIPRFGVVLILLMLVLISAFNGVEGLSKICSFLMPFFMISYLLIAFWILTLNYQAIPGFFSEVFTDFFSWRKGLTGVLAAAYPGIARAVYSGDIGIGYDSIVQSETQTTHPERQARIAIFALFSDSLICTATLMIISLTGVMKLEGLNLSDYLPAALESYLPFSQVYVTIAFFIAGFTTIVGYLVMGQKAARFIHPKLGRRFYLLYSSLAFIFFAFQDQTTAILVMSISGGLLMVINLAGVFRLRKEVLFIK